MPGLESLRRSLFALAALLAAGAAWLGGTALFGAIPGPAADRGVLERPLPAAPSASPGQRADRTLEAFRAITGRTLVPPPPAPPAPSGPPPFKLLGTRYKAEAPQDSTALVVNSRQELGEYCVGQSVTVDDAKLLAVKGPKARFLWRGQEIELGPDGPAIGTVVSGPGARPAAAPEQASYTIGEDEWTELYANSAALWTQVSIRPNLVNDKPDGVVIAYMDERFPGRRYGLLPGDVIHKVNGSALDSPQALMGLFGTLAKPQALTVDLERGGKRFALSLKVAAKPKP